VKFVYVSNEECEIQANRLQQMVIPPVKGTMKVHSVSLDEEGVLVLRDTSCYCDICLGGAKCESWGKVPNFRPETVENTDEPDVKNDATENATNDASDNDIAVEYVVGIMLRQYMIISGT